MTVRLSGGGWEAELNLAAGGSIAALRKDGQDVLRPMPEGSLDPLAASCFPLVPYCNRIRGGRFEWRGADVRLPLNFPPENNSLHGFGWQSEWTLVRHSGFKCALMHSYDGEGGWPWAYDAEQRIRLGEKGCRITLDVTNRSANAMPLGLGLHPYFRRRPETRVCFSAGAMVEIDERMIPTGKSLAADHLAKWREGAPLPDVLVDHCFTQWDHAVRIEDDLGTIDMRARGARHLHVYAPPSGEALCFEPVTHTPDALNQQPDEMIVLPPACTASIDMEIDASV